MSNFADKILMVGESRPIGTINTRAFSCDRHLGIRLFLDVTVPGGAGTVTIKIQVQDPASSQWHDLPTAVSAAVSAIGREMLTVYPGLTEVANKSVSGVMSGPYRISATVGGNAVTFSVGACLLP